LTIIPLSNESYNLAAGLICNDLWGYHECGLKPLSTIYSDTPGLDLILHATNGEKIHKDTNSYVVFNTWHEAFLRMTSYSSKTTILTVDSCTDWYWDGNEEEIDKYKTSSQSGVIDWNGWKTEIPRYGRQYFYHELKLPKRHIQSNF
jgi:hypothetical protein